MKEHIVVVDDNKPLCNVVAEQLEEKFGDRYEIDRFYSARDALEFIREDIDHAGETLVLVASDERMDDMQGHELMMVLTDTHPKAKKIIFSAWSDVEALKSGINSGIDGFASKASMNSAGDELFLLIERLLNDYEVQPLLSFTLGDTTIKQADTLYEKQQFLKKRFEIYTGTGLVRRESLTDYQLQQQMEWDEFDLGADKKMLMCPQIRYVVALQHGQCVGGARIIEGHCPLDHGVCVNDGAEFNVKGKFSAGQSFKLDRYRDEGITIREISRLVIDKAQRRGDAVTLISLFRMIHQLTADQNYLFCTSRPMQIGLYKAIGFEIIGPRINYKLSGDWVPMMRDEWKTIHHPNLIPGYNPDLSSKHGEPIPLADIDKWAEYSRLYNEAAIEKGFYLE